MKRVITTAVLGTVVLGLTFSHGALAQRIAPPVIRGGDTRIYVNTTENKTGWHQTRMESRVAPRGSALAPG